MHTRRSECDTGSFLDLHRAVQVNEREVSNLLQQMPKAGSQGLNPLRWLDLLRRKGSKEKTCCQKHNSWHMEATRVRVESGPLSGSILDSQEKREGSLAGSLLARCLRARTRLEPQPLPPNPSNVWHCNTYIRVISWKSLHPLPT